MPATGEGAAACGRVDGVRGRPGEAAAVRGAVAGVLLRRRMRARGTHVTDGARYAPQVPPSESEAGPGVPDPCRRLSPATLGPAEAQGTRVRSRHTRLNALER